MLFRQVLHEDLGCASYLLADGGEAVVVDPKWEIDEYLALAREHGLAIRHVLETHTHADHVSGRGRLAAAAAAVVHVGAGAGASYPHDPLRDGGVLEVGRIELRVLATPGHRPEHVAFVVVDRERGPDPCLVLTGDSLFVGDVARPDLAVEPEDGARDLYRSLGRLLELPDHVEVWPGHVGGSLCGGAAMSRKPSSTLGIERRVNGALTVGGEHEFVRALLAELPPQPGAFERIVELNRHAPLATPSPAAPLAPEGVARLVAEGGVTLLDGREPRAYDAAHVPGSLNVTMAASGVGTRALRAADLEEPIVAVAGGSEEAAKLVRLLEASGFQAVRGVLDGGVPAWQRLELPIETTEAIDVPTLARGLRAGELALLDVREDSEWQEGHVPGSLHVPYHELDDARAASLAAAFDGRPLAVACSAGVRSALAVSLLRRADARSLRHVVDGGVEDLRREGVALEPGS